MKKIKYLKPNDLIKGRIYIRCHGNNFSMELLKFKEYKDSGFQLNYHFESLHKGRHRNGRVSLGEEELMLFDNLEDAMDLVKYCANQDFEDKELEKLKTLYINERVGFSISDIPSEHLAKIFKKRINK